MKDGIDPHALAAELKAAGSTERRKLMTLYGKWIDLGASAQGWRGAVGLIVVGLAGAVALLSAVDGEGSPALYAACALPGLCGVWLARAAFRREADWRRAHPFDDWRRGIED